MCLFLCHYHIVLITIDVILKSGAVMLPVVLLFIKIALIIQGLLGLLALVLWKMPLGFLTEYIYKNL